MKRRCTIEERLSRIEIKCDRIISELRMLRNESSGELIDRLHRCARRMREMARHERNYARRYRNPKPYTP